MDFDSYYWHDSILESIFIDRRDPGNNDIIEMIIDWYEGESKSKIIFKGVCLFKATMNAGIVVNEAIDIAYIAPVDDPDLLSFYQRWKGGFDNVKLYCYIIKTSATGSEIKILAQTVEEVLI
ncbi:hypothetical protein KTO58_26560 [Chitinophaga pendula]|uniref:hypothetical protein n=1 Tax=Chitinophaga TaxID=79328 RepID=UPI000BAEC60A|nr:MULTISPECIES: hypothetical protein [Chitinophaga]ASZ09874.1 hypothetical protein CK934_02205 [Chitinophaga sp. MD30]UCJ07184.1 hypothetical protein KTO58_26560 [Chitinophaga pendula]